VNYEVSTYKGRENHYSQCRIRASKDGVISKPEKIDPMKMERWWEG